mgnify:CR=1 FL=1
MKIAYLHNLPLEYYPPATNTLDLLGGAKQLEVRVYTSQNLKKRKVYNNRALKIFRCKSPDSNGHPVSRLATALWWHVRTAWSLVLFKPDAVMYVEPHSALAAYLYFRFLFGKARLFIHHHEYYEPGDYLRPGMRLPRLGSRLESSFLFPRATWISQTNADRLRLIKARHPEIPDTVWQLLPNYPPAVWLQRIKSKSREQNSGPLRLIYVGSASFHDTYIEEIVRWAARHQGLVELHLCGYNVAENVWSWLEAEQFANVTFDATGYAYDALPDIVDGFDVGLVLYKGNTTNFVYNVPNKVFEYLVCGLEVWYPREMTGMRHFQMETPARLRELDFSDLSRLNPEVLRVERSGSPEMARYCADEALAPLFGQLGLNYNRIYADNAE